MIGLMRDRAQLYRQIDARVDEMFARGVVQETERLLARGYGRELGSMKGLGYRQICGYLAGEYDRTEAVRLLKRDTRRFAKRQLTWFRSAPGLQWQDIGAQEGVDTVTERLLQVVQAFLRGIEEQSPARPGAPMTQGASGVA